MSYLYKLNLLFLLVISACCFSCNPEYLTTSSTEVNAAAENDYSTYCNPIDIDYTYSVYDASRRLSYRSGADPAVVPFRDEYYMFVTRSQGYWHSEDLGNWEFVRPQRWYFESSNAPAAWPMGDSVLLALGNPSGINSVLYTDEPKQGDWKATPSILPFSLRDPALFVDDDGRVYVYHQSSNVYPVEGIELDPDDYFLPEGEMEELFKLKPEEHGWERFGENHQDTVIAGFLEGPWMNKHDDTYYLQYAAPGTEWNVYGDGVYTSDNPLGPFTYEEYSPFSYKPEGFIAGAGHGSTVEGPYGNWWHFSSMALGVNSRWERRIGQFPAGFDEDGQLYAITSYGDYPHYLPSSKDRDYGDWFTGWMLLSYKKPVTASSVRENFGPENIVDENIKSFWVAESNTENEWLIIDLEGESEVRAIQLNYHDYKSDIYGKPEGLYHQYLIEYSLDGENWDILVDKRNNKEDVPNDYVELASPQNARYIRFTNYHVPTSNLAVSGLRVFGNGLGEKPEEPENFRVMRGEDRREAKLMWSEVEGAQGYHLYYGIAPDKLYNSVMVYEATSYQLNGLNVDPDYYFAIEAFNENGISERSAVIEPK